MSKLTLIALLLFGGVLLYTVMEIPVSDSPRPATAHYLEKGLEETGSANIVNAIVWDFRGYDTLGEEAVLFTAAMGIYLAAARWRERKVRK